MEHEKNTNSIWAEVEPWCVLHRIWQNFWMVLLSAAIFALGAYIAVTLFVHPSYTCSATFVVTPKYSSNVYASGSSAVTTGTAEQFASVLQSSTLVKRVRKEYGSAVSGVSVKSETVSGTNLIRMNVTGPSPSSAFYMATGILDHYEEYSNLVFNSVMLEVMNAPTVPTKQVLSSRQKRAMVTAAPIGALLMIALLAVLVIISGTVQNTVGARNRVDGDLLITLRHERKHRTLRSFLARRKTSLLISKPTTAFLYVETIHQLRSRVEHAKRHHNCKTFLITSVSENEGKSTVASNLALSLARRHKKVLLIDCDLRKSAQHLIFDAEPEKDKTFNSMLRADLEPAALVKALQYRKSDNLFCLFSSNVARHSAELLGSERMRQLLAVLRDAFEYVIIDSPPMGYFTDSEVLADQADASILVVRQDTITDLGINDAIDDLQRCKARFLGYVFNDVHSLNFFSILMGSGSRGYGYGYGKGYGYGYGYGYGKGYGYGYGYGGSKQRKRSDSSEDTAVAADEEAPIPEED